MLKVKSSRLKWEKNTRLKKLPILGGFSEQSTHKPFVIKSKIRF